MNPEEIYSFEEILHQDFFDIYDYEEIQDEINKRIDNDPSFAKSYSVWLKANNFKSWRSAYDDPKPLTTMNESDYYSEDDIAMESDILDMMKEDE